jgi:hypothetical protein
MLLLLTLGWPWVLIGSIVLVFGLGIVGLSARQWLEFLISLPFTISAEQTQTEKQQANQPAEDIAASNPGCVFVLAGLLMVGYGLFRWLT